MNARDLNALWKKKVRPTIEGMLISKGKEYANGEDRLQNFREAGGLRGVGMDDALFAMVSKHIVSWADYTKRTEAGEEISYEEWEEKLHDVMIYAFLHLCIRHDAEEERRGTHYE